MPSKKNRDHYTRSDAIGTRGHIEARSTDSGIELFGHVATDDGYVALSSVNDRYANGEIIRFTVLEFIRDGRKWSRRYDDYFRPMTLVTLAREFAAEIAGKGAE